MSRENWPASKFEESSPIDHTENVVISESSISSVVYCNAAEWKVEQSAVEKLINFVSSLLKLKIATVWILKFVKYWHDSSEHKPVDLPKFITVAELHIAEIELIKFE